MLDELKTHFGEVVIYKFNGTLEELHVLMVAASSSYNYSIISDVIYFITLEPITGSNVEIVLQGA